MKRALIVSGGWAGHYPATIEAFALTHWLADFEVVRATDLAAFETENLRDYDLIVPNWTQGSLSLVQEEAIVRAVEQGVGLVAWHGTADAFNDNHMFKFVLGGQFICHPGDFVPYRVDFVEGAPLVEDLDAFDTVCEQYYMHVDPANEVLATTTFSGARFPWIKGSVVPVAWRRQWGQGRVFYHSIGHTTEELSIPQVTELTRRAVAWACR